MLSPWPAYDRGMWQLRVLVLSGLAYGVGSLPFSAWVARWRAGVDLRRVGDGNVGAQNCGRHAGWLWGLFCAFLDGSKGLVVGWLALHLVPEPAWRWWPGIFVLFGHQYPVFLGFRGGKGVSTVLGYLLVFFPASVLKALAVIALLYAAFRSLELGLAVGLISLALLWLPVDGASRAQVLRTAGYLTLIGLKKYLDLPYERWVRAQHPPE